MDDMPSKNDSLLIITKDSDLERGWLLINAGILLIMWGVSWLFWGIYSYFDPPAGFYPNQMMLPANLFGQPGILFGLLALIYGMRRVKPSLWSAGQRVVSTPAQVKYTRSVGWWLAIVGGLITFSGVLFLVLMVYNLAILRGTPDANTDILPQTICILPGLVIGLPLMLYGSNIIIGTR